MSNIQITVDAINKMKPLEIVESPIIRDRFIYIWDTLWGEGEGEAAYEREANYFNAQLRETNNGKLQACTPFSIFTAFIDLAVCGLSLEPGVRALTYLIGRNTNIGTKDQPRYESRVKLTISGYGELVLRARCGQIRHADNPVLVYNNDEFSFSDFNGRKEVNYKCNLPHAGQPIIACYLRITRSDGTIDYSVMLEEDWVRLAGYSQKQNSYFDKSKNQWVGTANALYGVDNKGAVHIDPGFLMAKCIKHAFKTYPKMRIGRGTELQTEQKEEADKLDELYGIDATHEEHQQSPAPYGNNEIPSGVTVDADDDDGF